MKNSIISLAVLASSVAAAPFRRQEQRNLVRRDAQVVTVYVTATQGAVLYNDQYGNPYTTTVEDVTPSPTPSPASSTTSSSSSAAVVPAASGSASTDDGDNSDGYDGESGYSIAYAPYNNDHTCKVASEVNSDMAEIAANGYKLVRIYGTDCGQIPLIMNAAKTNDMKVFAGIWDPSAASTEAQLLIDGVEATGSEWDRITAVSVGNELINAGGSSAIGPIVSGISTARSLLESAGYSGPVTTVDTWVALKEWAPQSSELCDAMDFIGANTHAFFDANTAAADAATFVSGKISELGQLCGGNKDVVITESGWPSQGDSNGEAIPSDDNQRTVYNGLRTEFADKKDKLIILSAFDDAWKPQNQWNVEHSWGVSRMWSSS